MTRTLAMLACLVLAACNGTALVTLTATPASVARFLTYRVTLVSVALQDSSGSSSQTVVPAGLSVDLAQTTSISEIIGSSSVRKGTYTGVTVTVDYSNAVIVADDGTLGGVALTPQDQNGQSVGQVSLTLQLDPASSLTITKGNTSQLSLDFRLSATNDVKLTARTVTVTPVLIASSLPIDAKTARLRGQLSGASTTSSTTGSYTTGIEPFDGLVSGAGSMSVAPTATTVYEINGTPSIGNAGLTKLAASSAGTWTVAYGTLTSTTNTFTTPTTSTTNSTGFGLTGASTATTSTTTTTSSTHVSFTPTQVWGAGSVQGGGLDRISGIVTARNGNTLTVPGATWITSAGGVSFVSGVVTITLGAGTAVTVPGQDSVQSNSTQQISVGSSIDAFGTATASGGGNVGLDVTSGRVRLENTVASGLVTVQGIDWLSVNLSTLGGRAVAPFDFAGTGGVSGTPSNHANYVVLTSGLGIANAVVNDPVELTGLTASFGAARSGAIPSDFTVTQLLDPTTISAELVLDWGSAGTTTPFASVTTTEIGLLASNTGLGLRHQIAVGAQVIDVPTLAPNLLIDASTSTTVVYAIAHASTSTVENFNTFAAFATALQGELNGTTVATAITAEGIYTSTGTTLAATSVTVNLNI
ncbi:MAG: hypothetical protein ACHQIL_07985 [Steroidobacterales bacterium]